MAIVDRVANCRYTWQEFVQLIAVNRLESCAHLLLSIVKEEFRVSIAVGFES